MIVPEGTTDDDSIEWALSRRNGMQGLYPWIFSEPCPPDCIL